jgi:cardiolipin hydrolase
MHDKFTVIDESVLITGSFNWTSQAVQKNQENILFIENKNLATQYLSEFNKLWKEFTVKITPDLAKKLIEEKKKNNY